MLCPCCAHAVPTLWLQRSLRHYWQRQLVASVAWVANDFAFYGGWVAFRVLRVLRVFKGFLGFLGVFRVLKPLHGGWLVYNCGHSGCKPMLGVTVACRVHGFYKRVKKKGETLHAEWAATASP